MSVKRSPAKKKAATKASFRSVPRRSSSDALVKVHFPESAPDWKENLENNLVKRGFTRTRARDLVNMAAS